MTNSEKHAATLSIRNWAALGAMDCAAHSDNSLGPFLIAALAQQLHLSQAKLAVFSIGEMLAYGLAMFLIAPRVARISLPLLASFATLSALSGQILGGWANQFALLILSRLLTGIGFGLLNTAVNVFAARTTNPERVISGAMAMQTAVFIGMGLLLPWSAAHGGRLGVFLTMAIYLAVLLPIMWLQRAPRRRMIAIHPNPWAPDWPKIADMLPILLAMGLFTFGSLAVWPFTAQIGERLGLGGAAFGRLSGLSNALSFLASLLVSRIGSRLGRIKPTIVLLLISGVTCFLQAAPPSVMIFSVAFVANFTLWFFIYPYLLGIACAIDPVGRLPTLCTATWLLSQSAGTLIAGWLGDRHLYSAIGAMGFISCVLAAAAIGCVRKRHEQS